MTNYVEVEVKYSIVFQMYRIQLCSIKQTPVAVGALRAIPTKRFRATPTSRLATAVAWRLVGGEISNMLDNSRQYKVARRWRSPGNQSPSCPLNRPYPLGNRRYNRRYNRPSSADCSAHCSADRLVGMALKQHQGYMDVSI